MITPIEPKSTGNYEELLNTLVVHFSIDCLIQSLNRPLPLRASGKLFRFCTFKKVLYFISYLSSVVLSSPDVSENYIYKNNIRNKSDFQCREVQKDGFYCCNF